MIYQDPWFVAMKVRPFPAWMSNPPEDKVYGPLSNGEAWDLAKDLTAKMNVSWSVYNYDPNGD